MCHRIYDLEPLLTSALPAVVCPKPVRRLALDCLFQFTEVHLGNLEFLAFLWLVGKEFEFTLVVATFYSLHVKVIYCKVGFNSYFFCTCQYWSVVVEKVCPVMDVVPEWHLVGNETDNYLFAFLAQDSPAHGKSVRR